MRPCVALSYGARAERRSMISCGTNHYQIKFISGDCPLCAALERVEKIKEKAKRGHWRCTRTWHLEMPCNCGADEFNKELEAL